MTLFDTDDVERIGTGLCDRSLPKADWTHAAHFAAALWLLRQRSLAEASAAMPDIIRRYNVATGGENTDTAGYHETITQASLRGAAAFLAGYTEDHPLGDIANRLMVSKLGDKNWPLTYWTRDRLFSSGARRTWVEPDIMSLPW